MTKNAPIKILIILFITGVICIIGEIVLSNQLDRMQDMHESIMDQSVKNREYIAEIATMLYQHQAVLSDYALSKTEELKKGYLDTEKQLREDVTDKIIDFTYRVKGGESERIYHRVYSDFAGYEENASLFLSFVASGDMDMAVYYNDNVLKNYMDSMNAKLSDLDDMAENDIIASQKAMEQAVKLSIVIRVLVAIVVAAFFLVCIYLCFKIADSQEKYKQSLEQELVEKNKAIMEHNQKMLRLQDGIIYGMANLIESRDGETGEHVKRTSAYVGMIARAAQKQGLYASILTDEYIERLTKVAPLHDVGKIEVPDQILKKPGKLTEEEFEEIKKHATAGGKIIKEVFENIEDVDYIKMASDVASYHHEKWNGQGYGKGLKEEEIPLSARIMAIADVFDALISKRRYKEAFSLDKAFAIIDESAGSHFDPKLAQVFLSIRPEIEAYLNE